MLQSVVSELSRLPHAEAAHADRIGIYVMAAIFGVLVAGLIACVHEIRSDLAARR